MKKRKRNYFNNEEMQKIELLNNEAFKVESEMKLKKKDIELTKHKIEIAKYQIERMNNLITQLNKDYTNLEDKRQAKLSKSKDYKLELQEAFNIKKDDWGFDPDTGEII